MSCMILLIFKGKASLSNRLPLFLFRPPLLFKAQSLVAIYHSRLNTISTTTNLHIDPNVSDRSADSCCKISTFSIYFFWEENSNSKLLGLICFIMSPDKNNKLCYRCLADQTLKNLFPSLLILVGSFALWSIMVDVRYFQASESVSSEQPREKEWGFFFIPGILLKRWISYLFGNFFAKKWIYLWCYDVLMG